MLRRINNKQTLKMERFAKGVNGKRGLNISAKRADVE